MTSRRFEDAPKAIKNLIRAVEDLSLQASRKGHGLHLKEIVYFTSSDTFDKADHPGLRAVVVHCQGAGGGGGGAASTGAGQASAGNGGGGGTYARSFILASDLDTSEAVTVGTGGAGSVGSATATDGGDSVFDTISGEVRGAGGIGGVGVAASSAVGPVSRGTSGGSTGSSVGDLIVGGGFGSPPLQSNSNAGVGGSGGSSFLGGARETLTGNANGRAGSPPGGGGSGGNNNASQGSNRQGGQGADGIVIVEIYV